ncbi:MAG: hypothetical protein V2J55_09870 [Candidatus Competibacteraceae bacterium]|nr:hypothetical protein [Candidatus Competibacteraceae bacterium]
MKYLGPKAVSPHTGLDWLRQAFVLLMQRPMIFIITALVAPSGSLLLLYLPLWNPLFTGPSGWLPLLANVICYGLPLVFTLSLACGFARAVNQERTPSWSQLLNPTVFRVLLRSSLLLFVLLLQGYLVAYWVKDLLSPAALLEASGTVFHSDPTFGVTSSILGTQLTMLGGLLLVFQFLGVCFVPPLLLFREMPLYEAWRHSFLAVQLNPWLLPVLGLLGLVLLLLPFVKTLSVPVQILALPLPVYLGALLYIAWLDLFQGGSEESVSFSKQATA